MKINERIALLRSKMREYSVDAYLIPSSDPHQSEYVADRYKSREWISGFNGSAGWALITHNYAGLWTDSRYYIQAEEQLSSSEFELQKITRRGHQQYIDWLKENVGKGTFALDGQLFSKASVENMKKKLDGFMLIKSDLDLINEIWDERPRLPNEKIYEHDVSYAGRSRKDKMDQIRTRFAEKADYYFSSMLDDIAWILNLRGNDIDFNPVFLSYFILEKDKATLFVEKEKLNSELISTLEKDNIEIQAYGDVEAFLNRLHEDSKIHLDKSSISFSMFRAVNCKIVWGDNEIGKAKAIKNPVEIEHIAYAMKKDGVALLRTFRWLENELTARKVAETEVRDQLAYYRSKQDGYKGESFGAIVGYKANGAIIHYSPEEGNCAWIEPEGMLLIDSGAQYLDGTTDTTRTLHLGEPTQEEKEAYTLVLKGHIQLDVAQYPKGTTGFQLDAFARMALWKNHMDYAHGTGHGVGFLLNVHEGPQGMANMYGVRSKTPLEEGMVTSNEPGFYKTGAFGIRIENLILTEKRAENEYGQFLGHRTLTLYPMERKLIVEGMLNREELIWLNHYHERVEKELSPFLSEEEKEWLVAKCRPLE